MNRALLCLCFAVVLVLYEAGPVRAQIIETDGPGPSQKTYMSQIPRAMSDTAFVPTSVRAIGIGGADTTQWGFMFIGLEDPPGAEAIQFTAGSQTYRALSVDQPDGRGPVTVFISKQTFFTLSESSNPTVQVGDQRLTLPQDVLQDMKAIRSRVL